MKRLTLIATLILGICGSALAVDATYINRETVKLAPQVDAIGFDNQGKILLTNYLIGETVTWPFIFETQNTRYYTNSGVMVGSQGFRFETIRNKNGVFSRVPAMVFTNSGSISGVDGFSGSVLAGYWYSSYVLVNATNIGNSGAISVENAGLMKLTGKNIDLRNGSLAAGIADGGVGYSYLAGRGYTTTNSIYINPTGVIDLNGYLTTNNVSLPAIAVENPIYYSISTNPVYGHWVRAYSEGTNNYVNVVYVRTNDLDPNVSVDVRFARLGDLFIGTTNDKAASIAIVRTFAVGTNVVDHNYFTNSVFLLDAGQTMSDAIYLTNGIMDGGVRPSSFEVTTAMPYEWYISYGTNYPFSTNLIYPGVNWTYDSATVSARLAEYAVQVGRNTESISGMFDNPYYENGYLVLTDPTNDSARIEINAETLKLGNARIRAEGLLSMTATNLIPGSKAYMEASSLICNLGNTNTSLVISNILPDYYVRCQGDMYATSFDWGITSGNGGQNWRFHVLVVDHTFVGKQATSLRNLNVRGKDIYVEDAIHAVRSCKFDTTNLTLNGKLSLVLEADTLNSSVMPRMKDLLVETNGILMISNTATFGADTVNGYNTLTNRGSVSSQVIRIKAGTLENAGTLRTFDTGIVSLEGDMVRLSSNTIPVADIDDKTGLTIYKPVPGRVNSGSDTIIRANTLFADYSVISNGIYSGGNLTLTVTNNLTDGVAATPTTNTVIKNYWQVKNGITLTRKPNYGDLFGTKITICATNAAQPLSSWAGEDYGAVARGFSNNATIGHLVLDSQTANSVLRFTGTSGKNAMYVDYLELKDGSLTNYSTTLSIDSSLKIYFADCNVDPGKLTNLYVGRLIWVPEFTGPNSATNAPTHVNGVITNVLVNRSLLASKDIDSNKNGINNYYDSYPFDGSVLGIVLTGSGTITPDLNNRALNSGDRYTITAVPNAGYSFAGWSWSASAGNPGINTNSSTITFTMQPDLVLTANFKAYGEYGNVTTLGSGVVIPNLGTNLLLYGKNYTIKATPAAGNLFAGWSGSVSGTNTSLTFTMAPGTKIVAQFVTNQFLAMKGTYNGLFLGTNSTDSVWNSGYFTVTVSDKGVASGRLTTPAGVYAFTSKFTQTGGTTAVIKRAALGNLTLNLQVDTATDADVITGNVTDANNVVLPLYGERAVYDGSKTVSPAKGSYTLAIAGGVTANNTPIGDAYGKVTVTAAGKVTWTGKLPDGTQITPTASIGKSGFWPFYYSRNGKDVLIGWLNCSTNDFNTINGKITWSKKASTAGAYRTGFTNEFTVVGSRYVVPQLGTGLKLETPLLTAVGGDFDTEVAYSLSLNPKTLSYVSGDGLSSIKVTPSTGLVTGKVYNNKTGKSSVINGVVLQEQNIIRGCFYDGTVSGEVFLSGH
jgi:hypothetical protein